MKRLAIVVLVLVIVGAAIGWILTAPRPVEAAALPQHPPDLANGERIYNLGGCSSCHATPAANHRFYKLSAEHCFDGQARDSELAGGLGLDTPFGVFCVPNITADPKTGIGGWSTLEFVNAMKRGVSPEGGHYYPAFPYASYTRMSYEDLIDLKAYLDARPPIENAVRGHALGFPFNVRRGLGLWKLAFLDDKPIAAIPADNKQALAGQYIVEGAGHCGECHSARNLAGAMQHDTWLAGAIDPEDPEQKGRIPNVTPGGRNVASWSVDELAEVLRTGNFPDFSDTIGGSMGAVVDHLAKVPPEDVTAISAYLKALPKREDAAPRPTPAPAS